MGLDHPDLSRTRSRALLTAVVVGTGAAGVLACLAPTGADLAPLPFSLTALGFLVAGRYALRLDLGRHRCTMTAAPVVLAAAVGLVPAVALGLAAAIGEAATLLRLRVGAQKMLVNLTARWAAAAVGAAAFELLAPIGEHPTAIGARSALAALAYTACNALAVSAAIAAATGRSMRAILHQTAAASGIIALAGGSLGASGRALTSLSDAAPALLAPTLLVVWMACRAGVAQRDQHLRTLDLYHAVAETVPLAEPAGALAKLCAQTARLASADRAVVVMAWPGTAASGAAMTDGQVRRLPPDVADACLAYGTSQPSRRVGPGECPPSIASIVGARSLIVASHVASEGAAVTLLAALADDADATPEQKLDTLVTYASHVALIASNFGLYADVQEALRHQVDLNQRKDEFVATLSHELRTPLTVAIAALEAVNRYEGRMRPELRAELLSDAATQAQRLRELIDDLLTVAAGPSHTAPTEVAFDELMAAIRGAIAPSLSSRVTVRAPERLDRSALTHVRSVDRILVNLLNNAGKYGGSEPIELRVAAVGDHLEVSVIDHGPGIPEHLAPLAFDRFVQLDQSDTRAGAGVGLGLYLCRKLADEIGASLELTTTPGGGATFTLRIPLAPDPALRGTTRTAAATAPAPAIAS